MDNTIHMWDLSSGQALNVLTDHTSMIGLLDISSSHLLSGSPDSTMRGWNPDTGALKTIITPRKQATVSSIHLEGNRVAVASGHRLEMWDIDYGRLVAALLDGDDALVVWQVMTEGRWCVAAVGYEAGNKLHFWDLETTPVAGSAQE